MSKLNIVYADDNIRQCYFQLPLGNTSLDADDNIRQSYFQLHLGNTSRRYIRCVDQLPGLTTEAAAARQKIERELTSKRKWMEATFALFLFFPSYGDWL